MCVNAFIANSFRRMTAATEIMKLWNMKAVTMLGIISSADRSISCARGSDPHVLAAHHAATTGTAP
jgi:hypothetical protein